MIVTDEQSEPGMLPSNIYGHFAFADAMPPTRIDDLIPQSVPVYVWNIGGFKHASLTTIPSTRFQQLINTNTSIDVRGVRGGGG